MTADVLQVRPVARQYWPQRVRLVGAPPPRPWNGRLAVRFAVAGVPLGALVGILYGLVVLRQGPIEALWSYAYGAGIGLLIGLVIGALLGAVGKVFDGMRWSRPVTQPRRLWVQHRAAPVRHRH